MAIFKGEVGERFFGPKQEVEGQSDFSYNNFNPSVTQIVARGDMLSFILPARNECESLARLVREIADVCRWHGYSYETIIIDDGSTDATWRETCKLAGEDCQVQGIRLRRNYGKGPALTAGFKAAKGDIVFTMDADLQDNPEDVPAFVDAVAGGLDVVVGWRKSRHDKPLKRLLSRIFNAAVSLTGLKLRDHNCGFKCFRAAALEGMDLYGDMHRYMPIIAHINGFQVGEVEVHHRHRLHGKSNYGFGRMHRGFFDLLTILFLKGFRHRPLHFLGSLGVVSLLAGGAGLAYLAVLWFVEGHIGNRPLLIYSAAFTVFGSQVLATGVLAELMTAYMARFESTYAIKDQVVTIKSKAPTTTTVATVPDRHFDRSFGETLND